MSRIVFIVEGYYPNFSAVGVCISNIIDELKQNNDIIVITKKSENSQQNVKYMGYEIRYVNTCENFIRNWLSQKIKQNNHLIRYTFNVLYVMIRGYSYINAIIKNKNIKQSDIKAYQTELESINGKIDVIIPSCLPFEGILASILFKNKSSTELRIIPLLFDKFSMNSTLHRIKFNQMLKLKKHLMLEKKMLQESEKILYVESWEKHLIKYFLKFKYKFIKIEHPLIKKIITTETIIYDHNKINIVYTGALYKDIRSPLMALELFSKLIETDNRILVHFYITGNCDFIVDKYCNRFPDNIINHHSVPTSIAKSSMLNADILLSIGNTDTTQTPSKIFEYISTGKPIIHFYYSINDPSIEVLKRYGNSYLLECKLNNVEMEVENIKKIFPSFNKTIQFYEVEKLFYNATPKFIAQIIKGVF